VRSAIALRWEVGERARPGTKCTKCPQWSPDILKYAVFQSWCAYVCVQTGVVNPPVVAIGAIGVRKNGVVYPSSTTAWCFDPINP
jgi:hypothetical protein